MRLNEITLADVLLLLIFLVLLLAYFTGWNN